MQLEGIGRNQRKLKEIRELKRTGESWRVGEDQKEGKGIRGKWRDWRAEELIGGKGRQ